ncbi:HNH endonuclease [Pseudomonas sp. TMB3-21]
MFKANDVWDYGFFKRLSKNDTGHDSNQSGPLINIEIQEFLPPIQAKPTDLKSAVSIPLNAELWNGDLQLNRVSVRYQIQSWPKKIKRNGEFKQEKRITRNMNELFENASQGDFLVMQRRQNSTTDYRFTLITKKNPLFKKLIRTTKNAPIGPIYDKTPPESFTKHAEEAKKLEEILEKNDFHPVEKNPNTSRSIITEYCRDKAFREKVLKLYNYKCAACRKGLTCPTGLREVDAAHIIPRSYAGANDARNGIALCKAHHWAFDRGLFWIDEKREIHVPQIIREMKENKDITRLHTRKISTPTVRKLEPDLRALEWHRENSGYGDSVE